MTKRISDTSVPSKRLKDRTFLGASVVTSAMTFIRVSWKHLMAISDRLDSLHIFLLAAGISFNVVLCLLPLLLVALYVAGTLVDVSTVISNVQKTLYDTMPATDSTVSLVNSIIDEIRMVKDSSSTAGYVGLAVLIWTSSALFSSLRTGLNAIFSVQTPKFFLLYKLKDLVFTLVVAVLILISTFMTPLVSVLSSKIVSLSPSFAEWQLTTTIALLISAVTAFIFFFVLLRYVPNKPQPMFIILTASFSSVVLWEIARYGFTYYLNHIASFGRFYGTFSVIVASAIWIYYSALIILVSAEVAEYTYEERDRSRNELKHISASSS